MFSKQAISFPFFILNLKPNQQLTTLRLKY